MWCIVLLVLFLGIPVDAEDPVTDTFYIRHFSGHCLGYDASRKKLLLNSTCKDKFRWKGGAQLFHVHTNRCVLPKEAKTLGLSHQCSGAGSLFQYHGGTRVFRHMLSGRCFLPQAPVTNNSIILLDLGCKLERNRFYLLPEAYFIIRHFSNLCWKHDTGENIFRLQNTHVCDRFKFENSKNLRHVKSGKCVVREASYLRLSTDCSSANSIFQLDDSSILQHPATNLCVHPYTGRADASAGTRLSLYACVNEDRIRSYFYDDRYILKIKIISESCINPASTCRALRGHITVNGYQHSFNTRGINVVVLDYRSGMFEYRAVFDVYGDPSKRAELTNVLNNLPAGKILLMAVKDRAILSSNLALALQAHGVSAIFATGSPNASMSSMATVAFTSKERKSWEMSVSRVGGDGSSIIDKEILVYHDLKGTDDCSEEMGMRTGNIADSQITAASMYSQSYAPYNGRLHVGVGYCSKKDTPLSHYLQVDLGLPRIISGIAIQGFAGNTVDQFILRVSNDGRTWHDYKDNNAIIQFLGSHKAVGFTKVNWFTSTLSRFIRVVPTARTSPHAYHCNCMRIELFGCSPKGPILINNLIDPSGGQVGQKRAGNVLFYDIAPVSKKITTTVSAASDSTTLSKSSDRFQFYHSRGTTKSSAKIVDKNSAQRKLLNHDSIGIFASAQTSFTLPNEDYYEFNVSTVGKILDSGNADTTWNTFTYETDDRLVVMSQCEHIERSSKDRSYLSFTVNKTNEGDLTAGEILKFSLSYEHLFQQPEVSYSNAYNIEIFMYYDQQFLSLHFMKQVKKNLSLPRTTNQTRPGLIHVHTNRLALYEKQVLVFEFKINKLDKLLRCGSFLDRDLLIDFKYDSNLPEFNGTAFSNLAIRVNYRLRATEAMLSKQGLGYSNFPKWRILFDDINGDMFVCKRKSCFMQTNQDSGWRSLFAVVSFVGIDTSSRILYSLNHIGDGYMESPSPFTMSFHIEIDQWFFVKSQAHVRMAKSFNDPVSLPSSPGGSWVFSKASEPVWAATKDGLMKKAGSIWVKTIEW